MFGISFEHILIVGVILILVGPKRLPELGNSIGKSIRNFKDAFNQTEKPEIAQNETKTETKKPDGSNDSSTPT